MDSETKRVPLKLKSGQIVFIEATPVTSNKTAEEREKDVTNRKVIFQPEEMAGVMESIEWIATSISTCFEKVQPNEASVEFGVEIGVESGALTALLVKGTGKANLKIALKWQKGNVAVPVGETGSTIFVDTPTNDSTTQEQTS